MDRSSRFGVKQTTADTPGEFMLLALVVGVMSAVKAEVQHEQVNAAPADPQAATLLGRMPSPSPELSPEQVVRIQLSSFKLNDMAGTGLRKAYEFASPESRIIAGPFERFSILVRNPIYLPLLGFESVTFGAMQVIGHEAEQLVQVSGPNGEKLYRFCLSQQQFGEFDGCWMTDRVEPA